MLLGIPADLTERIVQVTRTQNTVHETGSLEASPLPVTFISLPVLFKLEGNAAPHGLVLKSADENKTVLLTPRIDKDIEIPEEGMHQLPEAFSGLYRYFSGAYIDGETVILILHPEKLIEGVLS